MRTSLSYNVSLDLAFDSNKDALLTTEKVITAFS